MDVLAILLGIVILIFTIYLHVKIIRKAGYSAWWVLLLFIPIVNIIMIWVFAFSDWPRHRNRPMAN